MAQAATLRGNPIPAVLLALAVAAIVPASAQTPAETAEPSGAGLIAGGPTPDLVLLHSGDVIGYLDPCG